MLNKSNTKNRIIPQNQAGSILGGKEEINLILY